MAEPSWQELLRHRLAERNAKESAFAPIIEQYRRLAQQTKLLRERNATLLRAVGSVRSNPNSSTVIVPGAQDDNPVRAAYMNSLETQISTLRDELATVYKTQGQNAQRLLSMNETLREKEELARVESDHLRKARDEVSTLRRKVDQHAELMAEKDRTAQILHDEVNTLQLELGQIEERNRDLKKDNAKLLQRWLDAKQAEANKMNEANEFYETMRSQHRATVVSRAETASPGEGNKSVESVSAKSSGNGDANGDNLSTQTKKNGTPSPQTKVVELTPNG